MPLTPDWIDKARAILGGGLLLAPAELEPYGHDEFALDTYNRPPLAVARPAGVEQVAAVTALCHETGVPVTPRGGGTGLSAACVPAAGGIVLSLERLDKVIDKDRANHTITVQAGVTLKQLYDEVDSMGLYFPPHPGDEGAFVGGTVATNAGGARAVKYGTIRRFVTGLEAVTASGTVIQLGGKYIKSSSGYNLIDLLIGSEGTLAIITAVTLSLLPKPGAVETLIAPFAAVGEAIAAVPAILEAGIIPTAVEFVEHSVLRSAERLLNKSWPTHQGSASLMIILDGPGEEEILSACERIAAVLEAKGALNVLVAEQKVKQEEIMEVRSMIYESLRPATVELFDICVPRSEIVGHVNFVHQLEAKYGVSLPTYGHAADGNVHTHFLRRALTDGEMGAELPGYAAVYARVKKELYADAVRRGGIVSGEHGIGLTKRDYLAANLGEGPVALMRTIKAALDPRGIFNPGKIFTV
jgi:glycolate oxidase